MKQTSLNSEWAAYMAKIQPPFFGLTEFAIASTVDAVQNVLFSEIYDLIAINTTKD